MSLRILSRLNWTLFLTAALISQAFALDPVATPQTDVEATQETKAVALVSWNSEESAAMLARAKYKADFFPLANNFVSQENGMVCGPASAAIILNSLRLGKKQGLPVDKSSIAQEESTYLSKDYNPFFEKYTQRNIFRDGAKSKIEVLGKPININGEMKSDGGLQLRQLANLLSSHETAIQIRVVDDTISEETIKSEIVKNLASPDDFVVVNFARKALGQVGGGHISPLGAYDEESDSFLLMDVNPNRASWVWVKAHDLIGAMKTFDTVENRGYLLVSDAKNS